MSRAITFSDDKKAPQRAKSWQHITKFKDSNRLSTNNAQNARSSFSPATPTSPFHTAFAPWTRSKAAPKDLEHGSDSAKKPSLFSSLAGKVCLPDYRSTPPLDDNPPPSSVHPLSPWPALNITKRNDEKRRTSKRKVVTLIIITLIVLILLAAVITIAVILRQGNGANSGGGLTPDPQSSATPVNLPSDTAQCLTTFQVNAPTSPQTYPCGTCMRLLQAIPTSFGTTNPVDANFVDAAIQFCALKSIFDATGGPDTPGGKALLNAGWMKDVRTCTWGGATCNGRGHTSLLELVTPGVPANIPSDIAALASLESLNVTGNSAAPSGRLPPMSPSLRVLGLVDTSIQGPLPDSLFTSASKLEELTLVRNPSLGPTLPDSMASLTSLASLVIHGQNLSMPLDAIASNLVTLKILNLSSNSLSAPIPDFSKLINLLQLDLSTNQITLLPPASNFPPSLVFLSLANNPGLFGTLPSSVCSNAGLQTCNLRGTLFSTSGGNTCGKCQLN